MCEDSLQSPELEEDGDGCGDSGDEFRQPWGVIGVEELGEMATVA